MTLIRRGSLFPSLLDEPFFNTDWFGSSGILSEVPLVNIREKDGEYNIELAAPGMKKEDFHVTAENGLLTVSCDKEEKREEKERDFTRREYNYACFSRTFNLPESVKAEQVKAKYEDGVLKLTVPKKEEAKSKPKMEIKVA